MTLEYFTDNLLPEQIEKIKEERAKIDELIANEQFEELKKFEENTLSTWNIWRLRLEVVSKQDQPNTPEQFQEAQTNLSMWNEILLWSKENNPYTIY
jgi:hypothetical protein